MSQFNAHTGRVDALPDSITMGGSGDSQIVRDLAVDAIRPNRSQPRTFFDEQALDELVASIREHGLIQPLVVTEHADGGYELIAGERRWRAAQRAGLMHVPAVIKDATPLQLLELALVENIQRADLNPLEEGRAYQTLKDEFGLTDEEIARRVGKSRVAVANARRLIRLVSEVQQSLVEGAISAGHGRALLKLEHPDQQVAALALARRFDLSVREVERLCDLVLDARLDSAVQSALLTGMITVGHAQALLGVADGTLQAAILKVIVTHTLNVRQAEHLCSSVTAGASLDQACLQVVGPLAVASPVSEPPGRERLLNTRSEPAPSRVLSPEDEAIQRMFEEVLGTPVQLTRSGNTIRLTIMLYNDEQMQGLYDLVAGAV